MAAILDKKLVGMEFPNAQIIHRAVYDFSVDAGAVGALEVFEATQDVVVLSCFAHVKTTCTSGGLATLAFGVDADPDTLIDETAVASLSAGALIPAIAFTPVKVASGSKLKMNIATDTLTAGKVEFVIVLAKF